MTSSVRARAQALWARWQARPARERALMLIVAAALAALLGDRLWTGPAWAERQMARAQAQQAAAALGEVRTRLHQETVAHEQQRQQHVAEKAKLQEELAQLQAKSPVPVSSEAALALLETLVARQQGRVQLQALMALPDAKGSALAASAATPLYRHGLQVVVLGPYEALHDYLRLLAHEPQLRLSGFQLSVREHPELELTLNIEILSSQPEWLTL